MSCAPFSSAEPVGAIRKAFAEKPAEFDPRYYLTPARAAMQKVCEERMRQFGQAGRAPEVPIVSLDDMAKAHLAGKYGDSARGANPEGIADPTAATARPGGCRR